MTAERKPYPTDYWRPADAYNDTPEGRIVEFPVPEPDPVLDRAGVIFDTVLERIRVYEDMLTHHNAEQLTVQAPTPGDDIGRWEEYTFNINAQSILAMKYVAQGFYEELVSMGEFGRALAHDIVKSHGIPTITTEDWSPGIEEEQV